jgi:protocatechuate 3,4-dioxygenase, beta subunit
MHGYLQSCTREYADLLRRALTARSVRGLAALSFSLFLLSAQALAQPASQRALPKAECEGCGSWDAPKTLSWSGRIAPAGEPGPPLVVSGTVYKPDGRTPAAGVLVYAYHTNAAGIYPPGGSGTGHAQRHGRLRGFVRTDSAGRYQFTTIRPAPYPNRGEPAHIHFTVTPPGGEERWIDSIEFDDDTLLTAAHRAGRQKLGGSGIVRVTADRDGAQRATRNIVLETMR